MSSLTGWLNMRPNQQSLHLISFASGQFEWRLTRRRFIREAKDSGFFTNVKVYGPADLAAIPHLSEGMRKGLLPFHEKGYGYWVWKPAIILHHLESHMVDGEILVYMDVGFSIRSNVESKRTLESYIKKMRASGPLFFQLPNLDIHHSKWSVIRTYADWGIAHSSRLKQTMGGLHFWRKDQESIATANDWLSLCLHNGGELLTDPADGDRNTSLIAHRHDQSLLTLVEPKCNCPQLVDDTYHPENWWNAQALKKPFLQTRLKGTMNLQELRSGSVFRRILRFCELVLFRLARDLRNSWRS